MILQPPPLLITQAEAARICAISQRTIRRLTSSNRFPKPVFVGHKPRYVRSEIEKMVERKRKSED